MAEIILITGGARSGKSSYALKLAESLSSSRVYVATCPRPGACTVDFQDDELVGRIASHCRERDGRGWCTVEESLDLVGVLQQRSEEVVLIDCLTLWVNNLLLDREQSLSERDAVEICENLIDGCRVRAGTVLVVTNEVGWGVVPDNSMARLFRDLIGRSNQTIAAAADRVFLVVCGLPLALK
jgi:adenosylcobinamide kinase/adenosylcobinamide-phosphate guanylyltransferase